MYNYAKIDQTLHVWCGSIVMSILTKIPRPAKMMLSKISSTFSILVAEQFLNK